MPEGGSATSSRISSGASPTCSASPRASASRVAAAGAFVTAADDLIQRALGIEPDNSMAVTYIQKLLSLEPDSTVEKFGKRTLQASGGSQQLLQRSPFGGHCQALNSPPPGTNGPNC